MHRPTLSLLALIAAATSVDAQVVAQPSAQVPVVLVAGTGEVSVAPDAATIQVTIRSVSPSPAEAASMTTNVESNVLAALQNAAVVADGVRQRGYTVSPAWESSENGRRISGYSAALVLSVTTEDLASIGSIVKTALDAGATAIRRIDYTSSALPEARREALAQAIEQARLDAEAIAKAAGGELGAPRLLSTEAAQPRRVIGGERNPLQGSLGDPVDLTVRATVRVEWTLLLNK